jgi:predicted DNA binding CopG/RHH family protein
VSNVKLQPDERDLLESLEGGEYDSVLTYERRKELETAASHTFKKDKRINIRISNRDLTAIQSKAFEEGIPYQTLVSSIIHKYISGSLRDVSANKKMQPAQKTRD